MVTAANFHAKQLYTRFSAELAANIALTGVVKVIITFWVARKARQAGICFSLNNGASRYVGQMRPEGQLHYSAMLTPEPPISFGKSFSFGNPSLMCRTVSW